MNKQELKDRILKLRMSKELNTYSLIFLVDLPREKDISDLNEIISPNSIYIYNESTRPLMMGEQFNILVPLNNPMDFIETSVSIKYFTMNRKLQIDKLYLGISAIGLLEFENGIPPIINI